MNSTIEQTPAEKINTEQLIDCGCPDCGQRFLVTLDLLEWLGLGGCAVCRSKKEAETRA